MKRTWLLLLCLFLMLPLSLPAVHAAESNDDEPLLSFAVMSDTHVVTEGDPNNHHRLSVDKFTHALRDLRRLNPDFLVINGDLTEGKPEDVKLLRSIYHQNAWFPLYPTIGNHEYYHQWTNKAWDDTRAQELFRNAFGLEQLYYDRYINGVHLIFLAPEQYMKKRTEHGEGAWLSEEQIKWFEETLLSSKAPTFVFLHQHLDNTVFKEDQSISVIQTDQLKAIARKHPQVIWFSGHSHITADWPTEIVKQDGILYVGTGSVLAPIDVSAKSLPGYEPRANLFIKTNYQKSQSRYIDIYRDRIVIRTRNHHSNEWAPTAHLEKLKPPLSPN